MVAPRATSCCTSASSHLHVPDSLSPIHHLLSLALPGTHARMHAQILLLEAFADSRALKTASAADASSARPKEAAALLDRLKQSSVLHKVGGVLF